jgi:hypothetical protein
MNQRIRFERLSFAGRKRHLDRLVLAAGLVELIEHGCAVTWAVGAHEDDASIWKSKHVSRTAEVRDGCFDHNEVRKGKNELGSVQQVVALVGEGSPGWQQSVFITADEKQYRQRDTRSRGSSESHDTIFGNSIVPSEYVWLSVAVQLG